MGVIKGGRRTAWALGAPTSEPAEPMLGETAERNQARGVLSRGLGEGEQHQRLVGISY